MNIYLENLKNKTKLQFCSAKLNIRKKLVATKHWTQKLKQDAVVVMKFTTVMIVTLRGNLVLLLYIYM
jgi:hypothetical protein